MRRRPYKPPVPIVQSTAELVTIVDRLVKRGQLDRVEKRVELDLTITLDPRLGTRPAETRDDG